jgi:enoyl-CoA hydratase/carnithine racemase
VSAARTGVGWFILRGAGFAPARGAGYQAAMSDRVHIERDGAIAHVSLARPDKLNAIDAAMFDALVAAGTSLLADASLRCVVLRGQGRAFCAGLDVASFAAMAGDEAGVSRLLSPAPGSPANRAQETAWIWRRVPVPVIAAIHGACFGGGLQIALGADIRVVGPDAKLSVMEVKWGLIPDMSGPQTLRHLVRADIAKELTFTGRVVDAEEACRIGLATRQADDPVAEATALAQTIARMSPDAIRAGKRVLDESRELPVAEGLGLEATLQRRLIGSPNQIESVMANMQKRAPSFTDPSG